VGMASGEPGAKGPGFACAETTVGNWDLARSGPESGSRRSRAGSWGGRDRTCGDGRP
jgi:hypothetical protein